MTTPEQPLRGIFFETYSYAARQTLVSAEKEAIRFKSNYIGPGHILLALIQDESVIEILGQLNMDPKAIKDATESTIKHGEGAFEEEIGSISIPLNLEGKKILELARNEAINDGRQISPIQLLIGVVCATDGIATKILEKQGGIPLQSLLDKMRNLRSTIETGSLPKTRELEMTLWEADKANSREAFKLTR